MQIGANIGALPLMLVLFLVAAGTLAFCAPGLQVERDLNYELIHGFELWV